MNDTHDLTLPSMLAPLMLRLREMDVREREGWELVYVCVSWLSVQKQNNELLRKM